MRINVSFDQSQSSLPSGFVTAVNYVVDYFETLFTNNISINIHLGYGEIAGQSLSSNALGESYAPQYLLENYNSVAAALQAQGAPGAATMPASSPASGSLYMPQAEAQALGLTSAVSTSYVGISSSLPLGYTPNATPAVNQYYLVGVLEHEFTEVMGRVSLVSDQPYDYSTMDLFRYASPGVRSLATGGTGSTAYFSTDGGVTNLGTWNNNPSNGDLGDWYPQGPAAGGHDAVNDYSSPGVINTFSTNDVILMETLGWTTQANGIVVAATSSEAEQGGSAVSLLMAAPVITDSTKTNLISVSIKIANGSGNPVAGDQLYVNGQQSSTVDGGLVTVSWNASTDVLTLTGNVSITTYEMLLSQVTYKDTGTDSSAGSHPQRTVTWSVSDGTNPYTTTSQVIVDRPPVANNDAATAVVELTITKTASTGVVANDADLDGDTLIVTGVSDVAHGAGSVGTALAGVYGSLTLNADGSYSYAPNNTAAINAAPTGSHPTDSFTYTESDGNSGTASATLTITLDRPPVVTVANVNLSTGQTSVAASSLLTASDPDGNAIVTYAFMDTGPGNFTFNGVAQPNNHEIDVSAAQLLQLSYQSVPGSIDELEVRVNDGTLWGSWSSFRVTGSHFVIQTDGSTSLAQVADQFYLDGSGGSGPSLKFGGVDFVAGQFGGWTPFGAVQTASGYDVAFEVPGANEYSIWTTDSNGNFLAVTPVLSGNSATLESYEPIFDQNLNGDGHLIATVLRVDGATSLVEVGDQVSSVFYLQNNNGSGPALKLGGADFVAGQFGGWTPYGAVQTASGYDVAFEVPGANEYSIWTTDSNGNFLTITPVLSGDSATLESYEPIFNQDLNGDGVIGISTKVIQTDGSTSLTQVADQFYLDGGGGSGPALKIGGADFVAGQFGGWTPYGAVQTASGYDVAFEVPGANEYSIWTTDSNGNFLAITPVLSGNSATLESYEPIFDQNLNGDGVIGISTKVIQTDGSTSLAQVADQFYLDGSGGSGPALKFGGVDFVAGQFGGWTPFGAVQTASGYDVAFEVPDANEYSIWTTDSNGNFLAVTPVLSGNSATLESYEPIFKQDLNGDGVIGVPTTSAFSLQYKGFDYVAFYNGAYENSSSLSALVQTGANAIEATLDYGINVNTSQVVADPNYTDSLTALGRTIALAKSLGLSVMVRPLIDFLNPSEIAPYSVGDWRQDYQPSNVTAFFASYKQMIVAEAQVAQQNGAQMLSIGAELDQLTGSQYLSYWTDIINAVRAVFSGKLTYSASWNTASNVSFWNQLDYEGVDCYVPLSNTQNPTLQQLVNGWTQPASQSSDPGAYAVIGSESPIQYFENLAAQSGKPLLFTELGYANDTGAAADPAASGNSPDPALQAELYQAFFQAWAQSGNSSLIGTYFWEWDPNGSTSNVGPAIDSFSPQNNPAQVQATTGFTQIGHSAVADSSNQIVDSTVDVSTLSFTGIDTSTLAGGSIVGAVTGETLLNSGSTILGLGALGDGSGHLVLDNASGTIAASGGTLVLDTGAAISNDGTLVAVSGTTLQIDDSEIANTGTIVVGGMFAIDVSTLTLSGTGTVTMAGGTVEGSVAGETLVNAGNTISGTGRIGDGTGHLALDNAGGTIEASGGVLVLDTGAAITNAGTLGAAAGATLQIADHAIANTGSILVEGTLVVETPSLTLSGSGTVTMAGGVIEGSAAGETLHNVGNTISGTGTIGDGSGHLALDIAGGTIEASGGTLVLDTGTTVANAGTLAAAAGATLQIEDPVTGPGSATIGAGATLELAATDPGSVTFNDTTGTLKLDAPSTFTGEIFNFTGNGNLSGSDQIDLKGINYNSVQDGYVNGILTMTDGANSINLNFHGLYALDNFKFASDGDGGTTIYDPPVSASSAPVPSGQGAAASGPPVSATNNSMVATEPNSTLTGNAGNDTFVFAPNFGQASVTNFNPASDAIQLDHTVFATPADGLAAAHDDGHGNAVIADAARDTITLHNVAVAQLHQSDFLIV